MLLKDHPVIEKLELKGELEKPKKNLFDSMGYAIEKGDPVLKLNGKIFAEERLTLREQIILCECGAVEDEA